MLRTAQPDARAQNDQPHKQGGGELVGPGQGLVEHVARDDADTQKSDLGGHEQGCQNLGRTADEAMNSPPTPLIRPGDVARERR